MPGKLEPEWEKNWHKLIEERKATKGRKKKTR